MAQDYYYNGTKLNDWDGTKGVVVSTFQHDSSPEFSNNEVDVAAGPGKLLRSSWPRSKRITITGSVHGTDQADFEQRLDALKALIAVPRGQLAVTNYGTVDYRIAVFEEGEAWVRSYVNDASTDDGALWDFTNYKIGRRGLKVEAVTGTPKTATLTQTFDLSAFVDTDTIKLWAYVADSTKLTSVKLQFQTTAGNDYNYTWNTGITNGWNELTALRSALTTTGSPSWSNITSLILTVTGSAATPAVVTFDDLRITTETDTRTYEATIDGAVQFQREPYNSTWVPFSVTFSASSGRARSADYVATKRVNLTTNQTHIPLYLAGSGPQPLAMTSTVGSTIPSEVSVYDHYADTFGSYVGKYSTQVVTMESTESWTGGAADTSKFKFGTQGRKLTLGGATTDNARTTITTADYSGLANTELLRCWAYINTAANVTSLKLRLYSTYSSAYYTGTVSSGLADGWNLIEVQKKNFVGTSTPNWGAITTVEVEVVSSGAVQVTFDDMQWVNTLGCTGGMLGFYSGTDSGWEVNETGAYKNALVYSGSIGGAYLRNTSIRDGEIIALVRVPDASTGAGFWARSNSQSAYPTSGLWFEVSPQSSTTSKFYVYESPTNATTTIISNATALTVSCTDWLWLRLVIKGALVQVYYKTPSQDTWTKVLEASTRQTGAGYWGLEANGRYEIAHLEVIDYADAKSNALTLSGGPFSSDVLEGMFEMDSGTLMAREGPLAGAVSGSFPAFEPGFNDCAVIQPSAIIGSSRFRYLSTDMTGTLGFSHPTSTLLLAVPFNTGSQTYIRRRGSYVYVARYSAAPPTYGVTVQISNDVGGSPGTIYHASATTTIAKDDVPCWSDGTASYNSSLTPVELVFSEDIPVTASTDLWVVFAGVGTSTDAPYLIPWTSTAIAPGPIKWYTTATSSWAALAGEYGYAILAGNYPNATVSTPWTVTTAYTPSHL